MKKFITKMTLKALAAKENLKSAISNDFGFTHISEVGGITIAVIVLVIAIAGAATIYTNNTFLPKLWEKVNSLF